MRVKMQVCVAGDKEHALVAFEVGRFSMLTGCA